MSTHKRNILVGTIWSLFGQGGNMAVTFITNIILARTLSPYQFGQIGIIMFFIVLANVFTESGLAGALVRKKTITDEDYSTVFVFNLFVSIICYALLAASSGFISQYYHDEELQGLLLASGAILIINAFQITQSAKMMREMQFKEKSMYAFIATLIASSVGIILSIKGFGIWSVVVIQILTALLTTIFIFYYKGTFFKFRFSKHSFSDMYAFGVNTTLASLINTLFDNIYQLILGRYFSINQVGLFYQAKKLQDVPGNIIKMTTFGVVFASLSKLQDDKSTFIRTYNRIILLFSILMGMITSFIFIYSEEIITLLYGQKWSGSAFFMKLLCIASFFYLQEMFNRVIFKVFNQTRQILVLEIFKKIIQSVGIVIGIFTLSLEWLLYGFVVSSAVSYFINFYYSRKVLGKVSWYELTTTLKIILICFLGCTTVIALGRLVDLNGLLYFIFFPLFLLLYFSLLRVFGVANIIVEVRNIKNLLIKKTADA